MQVNRKSQESIYLTTGKARLVLHVHATTRDIVYDLLRYLSPIFRETDAHAGHLEITLRHFDDFSAPLDSDKAKDFAIRISSAKPFNLSARSYSAMGVRKLIDNNSRTAYVLNQSDNVLELFVSEASLYHLLETVRYSLLAVEQSLGTAIVHASAAQNSKGVVLVLGNKGRGKTTTLLDLVLNHGYRYFSGDKVLLDIFNGDLRIRSWPDYPHVGLGTFSAFPEFAKSCGLRFSQKEMFDRAKEKVLIDPLLYIESLGGVPDIQSDRCVAMVFPDVLSEPSGASEICGPAEQVCLLEEAIEDARTFTPGQWHHLVETPPPPYLREILAHLRRSPWIKAAGPTAASSFLAKRYD